MLLSRQPSRTQHSTNPKPRGAFFAMVHCMHHCKRTHPTQPQPQGGLLQSNQRSSSNANTSTLYCKLKLKPARPPLLKDSAHMFHPQAT